MRYILGIRAVAIAIYVYHAHELLYIMTLHGKRKKHMLRYECIGENVYIVLCIPQAMSHALVHLVTGCKYALHHKQTYIHTYIHTYAQIYILCIPQAISRALVHLGTGCHCDLHHIHT